MHVDRILTKRASVKGKGSPLDVVFEWEDVFAEVLGVPLKNHFTRWRWIGAICFRLPILAKFFRPWVTCFSYNIYSTDMFKANYSSIIPCIIDFWLTKDEHFADFYRSYDKCPLVLISSCEVFELLRARKCPLPIAHLALSISDKYRFAPSVLLQKDIDAAIMGRTSKVLRGFCEKYAERHPSFTYITKDQAKGRDGEIRYVTNHGDCVGTANTREEYMSLLKRVRVGLYSTPGVDGDRNVAYNQVTPRFLEYLVSGCRVLSRYTKNPDTDFYELPKITPNIETYEQFEREMDRALVTGIDCKLYEDYLGKHYTSVRARMLAGILQGVKE